LKSRLRAVSHTELEAKVQEFEQSRDELENGHSSSHPTHRKDELETFFEQSSTELEADPQCTKQQTKHPQKTSIDDDDDEQQS
jgi:hypothetical protein